MAKLINGNGNPAIYAAEDADLIASLAGNVTCIANVGNKYAATEEDATTIRLDDGVIITKEGRRIQLEAGESDTFYIPTGTSGQTNYYIIGYKLVQNADSTQVAEQFVQKMNSSSETITEDTFRSGATEVYVSVYRVTQVGFTIDSISGLLPELLDNVSIKDNIDQINSDLDQVNASLAGKVSNNSIAELIAIELKSSTPFIDFHFGNSAADFTSRIIESSSGLIEFTNNVKIDGSFSYSPAIYKTRNTNISASSGWNYYGDGVSLPAGSYIINFKVKGGGSNALILFMGQSYEDGNFISLGYNQFGQNYAGEYTYFTQITTNSTVVRPCIYSNGNYTIDEIIVSAMKIG